MVLPPLESSTSQTEYLTLSRGGFTFWWLMIVCIHVITSAYNAGYAWFYWGFDATFLSYTLEPYSVGMPRESSRTISYVHAGLAVSHGFYVLAIPIGSIWKQRFCFSPLTNTSRSSKRVVPTMKKLRDNSVTSNNADQAQTTKAVLQVISRVYMRLVDRRGLFGVNGKYFHTILLCRELLETALQTIQAVRMSKYLAHMRLNHFYVGLLVANCWSSVIIYSRWFWKDEAHRRFALVVSDCALGLMSTVGVSAMIVWSYVDQYNVGIAGFNLEVLGNDDWVAQMLNEAQMVLVTSWSDLTMRVIFSLGLIITSTSMQELLHCAPRRDNRTSHEQGIALNTNQVGQSVLAAPIRDCKSSDASSEGSSRWAQHNSSYAVEQIRAKRWSHLWVHIGFTMWGFVVLAMHMHASLQTPLIECMPKVRPMAGVLPSCFFVNFNCHNIGIAGARQDVQTEWNRFDRNTAVKLRFLHCPYLEIPDNLADFTRLQEIQVYNSTINEWGVNAAVTNTQHPELKIISMVRVDMTDGLLPLGLQSTDFPVQLVEIYFCETNLLELPEDLDTKWHVGSNIYMENSLLTSVPPTIIRLQPYYLVLAGNPITDIPPELFETSGMLYLVLGRTNITVLPRTVTHPTVDAFYIDVRDTEVSFFWSWMDPLVEMMLEYSPVILASGSPYCSDLENVMNGVSNSFSAPFQYDHSSLLMNASEQNWAFLNLVVDCSPPLSPTAFPLEYWDTTYSLKNPQEST